MRRTLFILLPVVFVAATFYGIFKYFEKDLEGWALHQLDHYSSLYLPLRIQAEAFELQLISPAVKLSKLTVKAKDPQSLGFDTLAIENVRINLDFLQALGGRLFFSSVIAEGSVVHIDLDAFDKSENKADSAPTPINWTPVFKNLQRLPLYRLALIRNQIFLNSKKLELAVAALDVDLIAFNQRDKLNVKVDLANTTVQWQKDWLLPLRFRGDFSLSPQKLEIHEADLNSLKSRIQVHGEFTDLKELLYNPMGRFEYKTDLSLGSWSSASQKPGVMLSLAGQVQSEGELVLQKNFEIQASSKTSGQGVRIANFDVGDFELKGNYKDKKAQVSDILLHHPAGDVALNKLEFDIPNLQQISLKGSINTDLLDIHDLLQHLDVGDLPVDAFLDGKLDCEGSLTPNPDLLCQGKVHAEQIEIRSGDTAKTTIAAIDDVATQGEVRITNSAVSYKASLQVFEDQGLSDGVIGYKDGFKINYSTPELHFKNVRTLAGLKIQGSGKISGTTSGDSKAAIFGMALDLKQVSFEDFFLGDPRGNLNYEKGNLLFSGLQGVLGTTKYSARVAVDLNKSEIQAEGQIPAMELSDVVKSFAARFVMPVSITGGGSAFVRVSGPLQFNQLTYSLSAQAFRGQIAGESFDRLQADISAVKGEVNLDKVLLVKNKSIISVFGTGHPSGQIDVSIRGDRFLLEESENVTRLSSSISGLLTVQMGLTGHVLTPDVLLTANLANLSMEEQEFPNSTLRLAINKKGLDGSANLLGNRLKGDFLIPLSNNDPFKLKVQAVDWNFATLFALIGGASLLPDYQTSLSGSVDLASDTGGFFNATGRGQIDRFLLQRGGQNLANRGPMEMTMKSGVFSFTNFRLSSDNAADPSFLELKGSQFTADDLKLSLKGNTNLRLLHIFVPFLEEFAGKAKISVDMTGRLTKPEILGSANVENGFAKIKGFPHPFERIGADVQFSISKILVNQFSGNLAGGTFKGDGNILIEGPKNLPMNLTAKVENASLNVPEGIKTLGDAELAFSGSWFPFLLSGTYHVKGGMIDKEFGEDASGNGLKQSSYLPKVILQSAFEPILLDIQVQIDKPLNIKNSLMEGSLSGQLQIKGPPTQPTLFGKIETEKNSKLLFKDKIFDVSTGNVQFKDPNEINPELYFSAHSRVTEYDVSLLVQGSAKSPLLRLNSVPPLSEPDLISLLALGVVTAKADKAGGVNSMLNRKDDQASAMTIGSALISNTKAGRELQETFGVNVQLSSSYDDTKNVSVQKITLSKKLSDRVNLSASRVQGQQNSNEYKLRYLFNSSVSAVGTYEERQASETSSTIDKKSESILGVDLEYKREFK